VTATESRERQRDESLDAPPIERDRGSGTLRRRLPLVGLLLAVAIGFVLGQSTGSGRDAAQPPLVTPAEIANAAGGGHAAVDDRGFSQLENGVQHSHAFEQPVDPAARAELARQLALARSTAMQYPTLADAERAGFRRAGPFSPGLGTHMINFAAAVGSAVGAGPITDDQIRHPLAYIYDGTKATSPIAGLFYSAMAEDPQGFAGTNDVWHRHKSICITTSGIGGIDTPLGADHDATSAQCAAVHGRLVASTGPLLHVWVVPGYDDSQGVFAHLNPAVTCTDGTYRTIDVTQVGTRTSVCRDGSE